MDSYSLKDSELVHKFRSSPALSPSPQPTSHESSPTLLSTYYWGFLSLSARIALAALLSTFLLTLSPSFLSFFQAHIVGPFDLPAQFPAFLPANSQKYPFPSSFPVSGNVLWYRRPATAWSKEYLPVGNGYLGAMLSAGTSLDQMQLNIESLWTDGPFANASYNGGNPPPSRARFLGKQMQNIRKTIFASKDGTTNSIAVLTEPGTDYGSYSAAPWMFTALNISGSISHYMRWLDLDSSVARSVWTVNKTTTFSRETFCSYPTKACVQLTNSSTPASLVLTYYFTPVPGSPVPQVTCFDNSTLSVRGAAGSPGMVYEMLARVQTYPVGLVACTATASGNATISVTKADVAWVTWVGGTEYDLNAGDAAHGFSFKGVDPHQALVSLLNSATALPYPAHILAHMSDYQTSMTQGKFSLSLGQTPDLSRPTDALVHAYKTGQGNAYLEWLLFNYGRYLLISSARGVLPANLQGKWGRDSSQPWGADYHDNINVQMNYWGADSTNLDVQQSLWNFMEKTWAPRGAETARALYNISRGWVTHNEMNIFGHTGMKGINGTAAWANYPESAVWMTSHIWDHFDITNDVTWWKAQGWPLLKGIASFHLDKLIEDRYFNDKTLVTAPCNSPEQDPITFGCAHQQQIIWQMLNAVEKGWEASGDTDEAFLQEVRDKRSRMDTGLRIGAWGQLQEWKIDMDRKNDTHREIAHLIGLYPGYALASYADQSNYTKKELWEAARVSMNHRGNGTGPDADAGWEKMWRAAVWAQFGDKKAFYDELTYGIQRNFASNLFSVYGTEEKDPIFQIDANLAYIGAVLNALVQAPDVPYIDSKLVITILPALPDAWSSGSLRGLRVRGGISLDLQWKNRAAINCSIVVDNGARGRELSVVYKGREIGSIMTVGGMTRVLTF